MKVIIFGATGMVGQGVLRECLLDPDVGCVLVIGRRATGQQHGKLREVVLEDLFAVPTLGSELDGYDACFFCLGVSAVGMTEAEYRRVTYDLTMVVARSLVERNPGMTFIYVSGTGTDSSERGRAMWARVKGATENALRLLPFKATYMFRPGYIQPLHGITSKTSWYRGLYALVGPLYPLLKATLPAHVTTTEQVGRAMIEVAKHGAPEPFLENRDIGLIGARVAAGR